MVSGYNKKIFPKFPLNLSDSVGFKKFKNCTNSNKIGLMLRSWMEKADFFCMEIFRFQKNFWKN